MRKKKGSVIAIITARMGSKRLPKKNIRLLNGIPLVAHSIIAAKKSPGIERCFVTTESPVIKKISLRYGSEVIDRPIELAADKSLSQDAVRHVFQVLHGQGYFPEYFVLLQPTSPLRNASHIESCLKEFFKSGAKCAISVAETEHHPHKTLIVKKGALKPFLDVRSLDKPWQSLPKVYRQNGAIYVMRTDLFLKKDTFFVPPVMPFLMSREDSVDIDTEFDLNVAEYLLSKRHHV